MGPPLRTLAVTLCRGRPRAAASYCVNQLAPHLLGRLESAALPLSCRNSVESFPQVRRPPEKTLIAIGHKRVETRSWGTSHRGPLAIHAAKTFPGWARDLCLGSPFLEALTGGRGATQALRHPLGAVVAIAELVDVQRITSPEAIGYVLGVNEVAFGDWTPGRYAWLLANVRPLAEPIPARGAQGLWRWEPPADLTFASRSPASPR
jgi:hypothetical protein